MLQIPHNKDQITTVLSRQWISLLERLNVGALTVDLDNRVTSINSSAQSLIGLKEEDIIEKDCQEILTGIPCLVNCILKKDKDSTNRCQDLNVTVKNENDQEIFLRRFATPIYDSSNNLAGCLAVLQDNTPISSLIDRIHHEEKSLKIILDTLDTGVFTVNRGGHITFFNSASEKIFGYGRKQALGRPVEGLFGPHAAEDLERLHQSINDGKARNNRHGKMTTKDGQTIPVSANYMALKNDKGVIIGGIATFKDLTLAHQFDRAISDKHTFHDMVGKAPSMQKIFEIVNVIAQTDSTILIEGQTGTGKDLLAKVIHSSSKRSDKPFIKVNCAALPDNLLESEMFGYVKGAFTGAFKDKPGRFHEADKGTIFLDEIGDLPLSLQAKLLRVIDEQEFYPLGSKNTSKVNVRIIAATNRGLNSMVIQKLFREDLFYRLNVFRIELPSLKDRRVDLPILVKYVLRNLCAVTGKNISAISEPVMDMLLNYDYPGNVRELENILEHALIICRENIIQPNHLPDYLVNEQPVSSQEIRNIKTQFAPSRHGEREVILNALNKNSWNRSRTSKVLNIDRTTLWRKMKKHNLLS